MSHHVPVRRAVRLLAACALVAAWLGTAAPAAMASPATATRQTTGYLRLAHLSPNAPAVDVYLYSVGNSNAMIVVHHVTYGTVSAYQAVPVGDYTVAMRRDWNPSPSPPLLPTTPRLQQPHPYTL